MKENKYLSLKVVIFIICIAIRIGLKIIIYSTNLLWSDESIPVMINILLILFGLYLVITDKKSLLTSISIITVIIILIISLVKLFNLTDWPMRPEVQKTFYSSPNKTNTIIVEKTQLLGDTNIDIYKMRYILFKTELEMQLLGDYVQVKWINDEQVAIKIDGIINILDLS